jgi:hypothetical protein
MMITTKTNCHSLKELMKGDQSMAEGATASMQSFEERRKFPRYNVPYKISLAVEDASCGEQIGIGEPSDISLGGLRVRNLPSCSSVRVGDRLGLVLLDREAALSLQGEVVHRGTSDTFGVEFQRLTLIDKDDVNRLILRLEH